MQTRIQGSWTICHRLHRQTVQAPVWRREGCFCTQIQQEHYCNIPAPVPLPFGRQGADTFESQLTAFLWRGAETVGKNAFLKRVANVFFCLILEQDSASPEPVAEECGFQERHHPASAGPGSWDSPSKRYARYARQCRPSQQHYTWSVHTDGGKDIYPTAAHLGAPYHNATVCVFAQGRRRPRRLRLISSKVCLIGRLRSTTLTRLRLWRRSCRVPRDNRLIQTELKPNISECCL